MIRKTTFAILATCVWIAVPFAQAAGEGELTTRVPEINQPKPICSEKCHDKRARQKLRRLTSRHPIPDYVVACESHGNLRALNPSSGAGGRYQILPSTWYANLPSAEFVRLAEGLSRVQARRRHHHHRPLDAGPRLSSRLLQDKVAANVLHSQGIGAWSCA